MSKLLPEVQKIVSAGQVVPQFGSTLENLALSIQTATLKKAVEIAAAILHTSGTHDFETETGIER